MITSFGGQCVGGLFLNTSGAKFVNQTSWEKEDIDYTLWTKENIVWWGPQLKTEDGEVILTEDEEFLFAEFNVASMDWEKEIISVATNWVKE